MKFSIRGKNISIVVSAFVLLSGVYYVFAAPPGTKYVPGETLAPTCTPGSLNCTVIPPAISGANDDITSLIGSALSIGDATTDRLTILSQILGGSPIVFQGATDNADTLTIDVTDPTGARTITFPDASGTVITTGNLSGITGLTTSNFTSPNISQWTNDSGYIFSALADNVTNALDLQEGANNYFNINTTDGTENISFGNATTNPSYSFLGSGGVTIPSYLDITPNGVPTQVEGRLFYDSTSRSLSYFNGTTAPQIELGSDIIFRAKNTSGSPITTGQVVYITGSNGSGVPTINLAKADDPTTTEAAGFAAENIAVNGIGDIQAVGILEGVNTSGVSSGDVLYVSATTAGDFTNTRPHQPNYTLVLGRALDNVVFGHVFAQVTSMSKYGAFIAGSVAFGGADGSIKQDSTNLFWDNTLKRLGIGDNTPAASLTVGDGDAFEVFGSNGNVTTKGDITLTTGGGNITATGGGLALLGSGASSLGTTTGALTLEAAGGGATSTVQIGAGGLGSANPDFLGVDVSSAAFGAGNPAGGFNGAMYYNTAASKFRCFESSAWKDCDAGVVASLQTAYNNGGIITTNGNDIGFTLTSGDFTVTGAGSVDLTPSSASSFTSGAALTLTGGAASTWSTTAGNLTLQAGSGTIAFGTTSNLTSAAGLTTTTGSGNIALQPAGALTNGNVQIGAGGVGSGTPDYLALDVKSSAGDPATGVEGAMYYNTADNSFRCYMGAAWGACDTTGGTATLQSTYTAGTGAISTDSAGKNIAFTLNAADQFVVGGTGAVNIGTTTDVESLSFGTGGTGAKTVTIGSTASTGATTINSGTGNITLQVAGTGTIGSVQIGAGLVGSSATPDFLGLDVKSTTGDPLGGYNGAMYYNDFDDLFRCYENGGWKNCGASAATATTMQQAYVAGPTISTTGSNVTFTLNGTDQFIVSGAGAVNIGTGTDVEALNFGTGGTGAKTVTIGSTASTGATTINSGTGNISLQAAGTGVTGVVQIGSGLGSDTPDLLRLDVKNTALDPAGTSGSIYYNSNMNAMRCNVNNIWQNCGESLSHNLQFAYGNGGTISTTGSNIALTLNTTDQFTASGTGSVNLTPTGASSFTSGNALTLTAGAPSTWSTSSGALTVDSAAALNLGTSAATSVSIGRSGTVATVNGSLAIPNYIDITTGGLPAHSEGRLFYDSADYALAYYNEVSGIEMEIGKTVWTRVVNSTGSTILKGKAVYINGTDGSGIPTVALARADNLATSQVAGLATKDITDGAFGYVTFIGHIENLDTSAFSAGDVVYLSAAVAGELTSTMPSSPNYAMMVGVIAKQDATTGVIEANVASILHGAFTSGSVTFAAADGLNVQDNANFFWDNSTKRLGIGDNTPQASLTVGNGDLFEVFGATGNVTTAGSVTSAQGVSIGAGQSYTGAGAVTLSSAPGTTLTVDSGTNGIFNLGTGNFTKTLNIGNGTAGNTINIATDNTTSDTLNIGSASDSLNLLGTTNINTTGTANTSIGNATGTFALTSNGGLNVTTVGVMSGVSSIDTISTSPTALTFAGTGTIDSGSGTALNIGTGASARAITVGNTTGTSTLNLKSGTGNVIFTVGPTTSSGKVQIGNSASTTPDLLVLDNGTADPTGVIGGMYFNTSTNSFNCYNNTTWSNCSSLALNNITAATGTNTIDNGNNLQTWDWQLTGATNAFSLGETAASSGTGYILSVGTLATSTAKPLQVSALGSTIIDTTANGNLTLGSTANNTPITLQSGTGAINIGTDANAKIITIGNITGATAVNITSGTGNINLQVAGTGTTGLVQIGSTTASATPDLLVLDNGNATATTNEATMTTNGSMYYNSIAGKFRCRENGVWKDCDSFGGGGQNNIKTASINPGIVTPTTITAAIASYLSVAITPTDATKNIWLTADLALNNNSNNSTVTMSLWRGATCAAPSVQVGTDVVQQVIKNAFSSAEITANFIDSPAASTATTYQLCLSATTVITSPNGGITSGQITAAEVKLGADLAEIYNSTEGAIEPGTVVSMDKSINGGVKRSGKAYDSSLLGVISTQPGMLLGDKAGEGTPVMLALSGRIPVKVSSENGSIKAGDYLTSSSTAGVAMKATKAGLVIGQAISDLLAGEGQVLALVKNTYYNGESDEVFTSSDALGTLAARATQMTPAATSTLSTGSGSSTTPVSTSNISADRIAAGLEIITPSVSAQKIAVDQIGASSENDISINLKDGKSLKVLNATGEVAFSIDGLGSAIMNNITAKKITVDEIDSPSIKALTDALAQLTLGMAQASEKIALHDGQIADLNSTVGSLNNKVGGVDGRVTALELNVAKLADSTGVTLNGSTINGLTVNDLTAFGMAINGDLNIFGRPYFNTDTAGFALIKTGQREVKVTFERPYIEQPIVNATLTVNEDTTASESDQQAAIDEVLNSGVASIVAKKSVNGFSIILNKPAEQDLRFSWIAVAVKNAKEFTSIDPNVSSVVVPVDTTPITTEPTTDNSQSTIVPVDNTTTTDTTTAPADTATTEPAIDNLQPTIIPVETTPEVTPAPEVVPETVPVAETIPVPAPEVAPEPAPEAAPEPTPAPEAAPESAPAPETAPEAAPTPAA